MTFDQMLALVILAAVVAAFGEDLLTDDGVRHEHAVVIRAAAT